MYLGVDIGGTKTLIATLDDNGVITEKFKFPTPKSYTEFLGELANNVGNLSTNNFTAATVAAPGRLNREQGKIIDLPNLPWQTHPLQQDCEKIFHCPTLIENDANLAGLSEAMLHKDADKVLYVTVSTGIGVGVIKHQRLEPALLDSEGGHMLVSYRGKLQEWESFASGRAIYERFGKKAADIPANDKSTWQYIAHNIATGMFELIAIIQPDIIIIGGSIGTYFDRYSGFLTTELCKHEIPVVQIPKVVQAKRPEEAVVYGCYDLAKQTYGTNQ